MGQFERIFAVTHTDSHSLERILISRLCFAHVLNDQNVYTDRPHLD